jgi:dTMP kinase
MKRAYLIVFTGIDGSGKSTQAKRLIKSLEEDNIEVSYIYCRWDQILLALIKDMWKRSLAKKRAVSDKEFDRVKKEERRKLLSNPIFRRLWLIYFFIDYFLQLFVKLHIRLINKKLIISDRFVFDSVIDQAVDLGEDKNKLLDKLDSFLFRILFPHPDLVIYVDCPEKVAFSRKNDIPDIDYLFERRELYLKLAQKYNWFKVDGTLPADEIAMQIRNKVFQDLLFYKDI